MPLDADRLADELLKGVKLLIEKNVGPLREENADLRKRLIALEEKGVRYRGVYQRAERYTRGDTATHAGQLWFCATDTADAPGGSLDWQLMSKAGK